MPPDAPRPATTPLRAQLAALAERMEALREVDASKPLVVTFERDGVTVRIVVKPDELKSASLNLPPIELALLRAATNEPQSARTLARLAGYSFGSHVTAALTSLCRQRHLSRTPDGYFLPGA